MELARIETRIKKANTSQTGELIDLSDNKKIKKLEKKFGHLSPQELMDTDISDRKKRILSGIQIVALQSLDEMGKSEISDATELAAWEECHAKASGEVLQDARIDNI